MRFQVPQFIEVEDKIFGPLTFKQFVYLAGGVGLAALLWILVPLKIVAIPLIIAALSLSGSLAFLKINNKPFIEVMRSAIYFLLNHKLYIWRKETVSAVRKEDAPQSVSDVYVPKLSSSKLKEISWALDVEDLAKKDEGGNF
jgi:hypothetical protein